MSVHDQFEKEMVESRANDLLVRTSKVPLRDDILLADYRDGLDDD